MKELEYPFDSEEIIRKKKSIRKQLLEQKVSWIDTRIAILGGQTTQNIKLILELFLLNYGIKPTFYESEYNKYYEDGMFPNPELEAFAPDIIYVCTCNRNIVGYPEISEDVRTVQTKSEEEYKRFEQLWNSLEQKYGCQIVQNNFEYPYYRLMGNRDAYDPHGRVRFINELNMKFADYAYSHDKFHICDINYLSSVYGLNKWSDPFYWHMYKYALAVPAIPELAFNLANIIKSIYGRNKKALNLDLDNTLWGGVVGDDGADNIEIGQETALAQTYSEFQQYLKQHKQLGVLLTVNSKNDEANALAGLNRPDSVLKPEDFVSIKANWNPKSENLAATASELNILPESLVFVDDNPAERAIIEGTLSGVAIPAIEKPEHYIEIIDKSGFFEVTTFSADDAARTEMYVQNAQRMQLQSSYENYEDYLKSLEMIAEIQPFAPQYMSRIAQLTNKSNQFNLTTVRYTQQEIEAVAADNEHITLYGKLEDRFGDNGVVSVCIGRIDDYALHIELWLMSCRVLKRDMEYAMMDKLAEICINKGIKRIFGYYYPTAKNAMVKDFYSLQGFEKINEDDAGNTVWSYVIPEKYSAKQHVISVK